MHKPMFENFKRSLKIFIHNKKYLKKSLFNNVISIGCSGPFSFIHKIESNILRWDALQMFIATIIKQCDTRKCSMFIPFLILNSIVFIFYFISFAQASLSSNASCSLLTFYVENWTSLSSTRHAWLHSIFVLYTRVFVCLCVEL